MRSRIMIIITALVVALVSGCCVTFSDQPAGATFNVGNTIPTSPVELKVEQFQRQDGTWTSDGEARVDTQNHAKGSGKDLNTRNVNVSVGFNYPVKQISFSFGELGGFNNIKVNGDFRNVRDLVNMNGAAIGGVNITVNATQQGNNWYGKMTLQGTINNFVVGGEELWVDDICYKK